MFPMPADAEIKANDLAICIQPHEGIHLEIEAKVPGTEVFGYGHVWRFTLDGEKVAEYDTETHGGMAGFLGVTTSAAPSHLGADDRSADHHTHTSGDLQKP